MSDNLVSVDEYLNARKGFTKGDSVIKAAKAPTSWDPEKRSARFVMSAEVEDRDRDIVVQAGLGIDEFLRNPVAPFSHRSNDFPVGTWSDVEKLLNGRPRRTEGTLTLIPEGTDGVADRLAFHIASGSIRACSIGFIPKTIRRREKPQDAEGYSYPGYMIEEAELVECSPVTIPSNPAALAKSAAEGDVLAKEIIEQVLDEWVKHPESGLLIPRAEFEAAHKVATGERTSVTVPSEPDASRSAALPPPQPERSLVRRAIDAVLGRGEQPDGLTDNLKSFVADMTAERERQAKLDGIAAAHQRFIRRHEVSQRRADLKGRLEAKGLA